MIKLESTVQEYVFKMGDESGYGYEIRAILDKEWGWQASVTMNSFGMKTADSAVESLRLSAEHFLRQLKDGNETPTRCRNEPCGDQI